MSSPAATIQSLGRSPEAIRALEAARRRARLALRTPRRLTVSQWADRERRLSSEASAEEGIWRTERAEYQRGILDAFTDGAVEIVVVQSASQVGKSECLLNVLGYFIDQDPSPILVVQPTLEMALVFSKDRIAPMLRDTPALVGKVSDPRSRDSSNRLLHKEFPGGRVSLCGANSPSSLAMRPVRLVLCDEIDRFPDSAGTEGDPIELARKRTTTFWNRKIGLFSTPTIRGISRIEAAYAESDQRIHEVPCFACGHYQRLRWAQVRWTSGHPETAVYVCEACEAKWDDPARCQAVRAGRWVAQAEFRGTAGFHVSELYSPWVRLAETARNFLLSKPYRERLHAWVNTTLGETWEEGDSSIDPASLFERRERYGEGVDVPAPVVLLTAGVDIQDDRIEVEIEGWAVDEENWGIAHEVLMGDPSAPAVWGQLADVLARRFRHARGIEIPVVAVAIDSGGHHTQAVYTFCRAHAKRRIWATKGMGGQGRPLVARPSKNNALRVNLFPIGVDTAKQAIIGRLGIPEEEKGPGYRHFPLSYDEEFFRQLAAEQLVRRMHKGRERLEWIKVRPRNEALDLLVLNLAALVILNPDLPKVAARFDRTVEAAVRAKEAGAPAPASRREPDPADVARAKARRDALSRGGARRRGFVKGWSRW